MTSFARYYDNQRLYDFSMTDIETMIADEKNKQQLANIIYHRYYDRYLKLFYFNCRTEQTYRKTVDGKETEQIQNEFITEYKSGFAIMTDCCLIIEIMASQFEGINETTKTGSETFKAVFKKAATYPNALRQFETTPFYKHIHCGLLHQGETTGKFKIRRPGVLSDEQSFIVKAKRFCDELKRFLDSYRQELKQEKWDSEIWDKCRVKLRHIINNSR